MSTVIAHMRAAATLDEEARIVAAYLRSLHGTYDEVASRVRKSRILAWAERLEEAVEIANEERIDTELVEVPMQMAVQKMSDELRRQAAERAGTAQPVAEMVEWQAATRLEEYEAERRWLINENQRLRTLNASHLARVARAEGTP